MQKISSINELLKNFTLLNYLTSEWNFLSSFQSCEDFPHLLIPWTNVITVLL